MRAGRGIFCSRRAFGLRAGGAVGVALLGLAALGAGAGPAAAWEHHGPRYTLKVVEGETTLPEYRQVASTSGSAEPNAKVAVSISRGGTVVYKQTGEGGAWLSQVPQVGDVVTLESPLGRVIGSEVYDGLPAMDATVCAGSTNFSGENTSGFTVEGTVVTLSPRTNPYGQVTGVRESGFGEAQVKTLSGTTFGGNFLVPLQLGETVTATESLKTLLAEEATYTYVSENSRPVGACPAPPPVPPAPPAPPALEGSVMKLGHVSLHSLLKSGWKVLVGINQAGTVVEDLYMRDGTLPAFASSNHHHTPPAVLIARGYVTARAAGTVSVLLRVTREGRIKLRSAKSLHAALLTTLDSSSGSKLGLGRKYVAIH